MKEKFIVVDLAKEGGDCSCLVKWDIKYGVWCVEEIIYNDN